MRAEWREENRRAKDERERCLSGHADTISQSQGRSSNERVRGLLYLRGAVPNFFDELVCLRFRAWDHASDRLKDGYRACGIFGAEVCGGEREVRLDILRLGLHARLPNSGYFVVAPARHIGRGNTRIGGGAGLHKRRE